MRQTSNKSPSVKPGRIRRSTNTRPSQTIKKHSVDDYALPIKVRMQAKSKRVFLNLNTVRNYNNRCPIAHLRHYF